MQIIDVKQQKKAKDDKFLDKIFRNTGKGTVDIFDCRDIEFSVKDHRMKKIVKEIKLKREEEEEKSESLSSDSPGSPVENN